MKPIEMNFTISERESWRSKEGLQIKSNLADDKMVECDLSKILVDELKEKSAIFDPDKFLLTVAETQKREITSNLEAMDEMALQSKVHADKAQELMLIAYNDSEEKYLELEKKFSETEKRFREKMSATTSTIETEMEKLTSVEKKLSSINEFSLERLSNTIEKLIKLAELDPDLVKLVFDHKKTSDLE